MSFTNIPARHTRADPSHPRCPGHTRFRRLDGSHRGLDPVELREPSDPSDFQEYSLACLAHQEILFQSQPLQGPQHGAI